MSMKIKSVTIEGMHKVAQKTTYTFNNLSYLFGKNGAGKSTVLEAIQLALLGYIPGQAKTKEALLQHASGRVMEVKLVLVDSNAGTEVSVNRTFINTGKSTSSSTVIEPEGFDLSSIIEELELPVFNFDEFKSMTSNKLKDWFIQFLPESSDSIEWDKELREAVESLESADKEDEIVAHLSKITERSETGLTLVRAVNADLKDELSYEKGRLQRIQGTLQSLVHYDDAVSGVTVEELEAAVDKDNAILRDLAAYQSQCDMISRLELELATIDAPADTAESDTRYIQNTERITEIDAELSSLSNARNELDLARNEISSECSRILANLESAKAQASGKGICPLTQLECDTAAKYISSAQAKVADLQTQLSSATSKLEEIKKQLADNQFEASKLATELNNCKYTVSNLINTYMRRDSLKSQLTATPTCPTSESTEDIMDRIRRNREMITKVAANTAYSNMMESETREKFRIELRIELIKAWIKLTDANGLQTKMMNKPFLDLQDKINEYLKVTLGKGVSAHFNLVEKANSFSFGILRNESYIPFDLLSSGEKCLFTLALMMCIIKESKSPLKVILIDDLLDHLDIENIDKLFSSLYKVKDIQFILAGVQPCNISQKDEIVINIS